MVIQPQWGSDTLRAENHRHAAYAYPRLHHAAHQCGERITDGGAGRKFRTAYADFLRGDGDCPPELIAAHTMMMLGWTWRDLMATPVIITERRLLVEHVRLL